MKRSCLPAFAVALCLAAAAPASAATSIVGNDAIPRSILDTWAGFTAVDSANSVAQGGAINQIAYYAQSSPGLTQGKLALAIVRPQDDAAGVGDTFMVLWTSGAIVPTMDAVNTVAVPSVAVLPGDDLAVWVEHQGVVPFDPDGSSAATQLPSFTWPGTPMPQAGQTITVQATGATLGQQSRKYSMNAAVLTCTYAVQQPINITAPYSVFRQGRGVVPVKVRSSCGEAGGAPAISLSYTGTSSPTPNETVSSVSAADVGAVMRFDAAAQQYVYNLDTKSKQAGTYVMTVGTPAGLSQVTFSLSN